MEVGFFRVPAPDCARMGTERAYTGRPTRPTTHTYSSPSASAALGLVAKAKARTTTARSSPLEGLAEDELSIVLSTLDEPSLAAVAGTSRRLLAPSCAERSRRREMERRRKEQELEELRLEQERFAAYESAARLVCTVVRYMMLNAPPRGVSLVSGDDAHSTPAPAAGVHRLRVGIGKNGETTECHAERVVDVLAMDEAALREVAFLGAPLGAAGAAVAVRQARALKLDAPVDASAHGQPLQLFVRADVIRAYMASSPSLAKLLAAVPESDDDR